MWQAIAATDVDFDSRKGPLGKRALDLVDGPEGSECGVLEWTFGWVLAGSVREIEAEDLVCFYSLEKC